MLYWLHQSLYVASVIAWVTAALLLLRDFFREYRGKVYDDSNLSQKAGMPGHETVDVPYTPEYEVWMKHRSERLARWLKLFGAGIILHVMLHMVQAYVLPSFEIPFTSSPTTETTDDAPPDDAGEI